MDGQVAKWLKNGQVSLKEGSSRGQENINGDLIQRWSKATMLASCS